ncbi:MAG: response regulator [Thermodesulfovibrionales bacterium]
MNQKLYILNLEDNKHDTELIQATLEEEGIACDITRVETEAEFVAALDKAGFDLLLIDYNLPSFDGMSALAIAKGKCPKIPFIFVSGSIGEDMAIEALKNGATDYVLKNRLTRLAPAVRRALKEKEDRSEWKRAEAALRESEENYRHLVENLGKDYFFYRHDTSGVFIYLSPSVTDMLGYSQQEISTHYSAYLTDNPINKEVVKHTDLSIQGYQQPPYEVEILHKDGSVRWLEVSEYPVRKQDGFVIAVDGIARDITESKRVDEVLRVSEKQYRQLVDNALVGVYRSTPEGKFLYVNDALARIFECENTDEMLLLPVEMRYKRPEDRKAFLNILKEQGKIPVFETEVPTKTGKLKTIVISAVLEDNIISGMVADITERKHLEAQLRHAQKMEAIGTLAGGIAHDFNNILNVIMGYGSMVLDRMEADSLSKGQMNEVLAAAERAAVLTKRLLTFSRKQVVDVKPINVNETVSGIQKMLTRIIGEDIDFQLNLEDRSLGVMADAGQIEQVLMNLVSNARDAMPNGGRLTIGTGLQEIDDEYIALNGYGIPGKYAIITITDTGHGMDAETQKKIFEPFFTMKGIGEGTGLGLAISYGIIKQHNGYIKVYSEPEKGTLFKIYLPLVEETTELDKKTEAAASLKGGNETILVAEDDASLRKMSRIVLESFGYSVITAEDGEDAITKFMEKREGIDLVILDMIMPKKNGKEVGEVLRKTSSGIKILFASGYTMDKLKTHELTESGFDFIHKPVSPQDLLRKVREVLDK